MKQRSLILLILLLACALRLYHIDFPVGGFAAWRQADTAAMAKNFFEGGYNLSAPQIDWGGNTPGYVETEFPAFSFIVAFLYHFLGMSDLWARLLAVACSCATVAGLYLLVKLTVDETVALWSALVYAILPLNVFYGRTVMSDAMMLMSSVWGIYWFALWLENGKTRTFAASALALALALLLNPSTVYLGIPLLFLVTQKYGAGFLRRPSLWVYALMAVFPAGCWYYHAHQTFLTSGITSGIWEYWIRGWDNFSPLLSMKFYNDLFINNIIGRHLTYPGFILFIGGLFIPWRRKNERMFDWWLAGILLYIAIVPRGNQLHEYYQLPFTLPAVVFIAKTIAEVLARDVINFYWQSRRAVLIFVVLCIVSLGVLSFLRVKYYMDGERLDGSVFLLGDAVRQATGTEELLVAVDAGDPTVLYRCGRRGWHTGPDDITPALLEQLHFDGASYLVGTTEQFDTPEQRQRLLDVLHLFPIVTMNESYFIIRLSLLDASLLPSSATATTAALSPGL
jgi:4-amino-4-deoxy-L-arabinose transferase-like glycosyltransferase